ncbi:MULTISPECIES: hypothetical protein [unclassified Methanosarcina]|uniref:hypothetical protein n=1 Tax=unclassified Methanosarcina TaxID=2644672 RepID=UPI0012E049CC|nr:MULTISPECIES: hypothetical protein [unclassified Methanosarcina]
MEATIASDNSSWKRSALYIGRNKNDPVLHKALKSKKIFYSLKKASKLTWYWSLRQLAWRPYPKRQEDLEGGEVEGRKR